MKVTPISVEDIEIVYERIVTAIAPLRENEA
jgi:hypothetical protein